MEIGNTIIIHVSVLTETSTRPHSIVTKKDVRPSRMENAEACGTFSFIRVPRQDLRESGELRRWNQ